MARIRARRTVSPPLPDMVPAEQIPASRSGTTSPSPRAEVAPELQARRERLLEQFTITQLELGGAFYEMAIRDHVSIDALLPRAAELQRIDAELAQVDQLIASGGAVSGSCPACEAPFARGAVFCWQCGSLLSVTDADA
jgi:hypothetical protein